MVGLDSSPLVSFASTEIILYQMKNCICNIILESKMESTGCFCYIPYKNKKIPVLITCNHVIDEYYLENYDKIKLLFKDGNLVEIKDLKNNRRIYTNKKYNITIIEIKEEDNINNQFLELDYTFFKEHSEKYYIQNEIYTLQYINNKGLCVSYGIVKDIIDNKIIHLCSSNKGSSGSPIINLLNNKVIGIHVGNEKNFKRNFGTCLKYPIMDFINSLYDDSEFENIKLMSSGTYGDIYSAYLTKYKEEICLKKINIEKMRINYEQNELKDYQKDLYNEINILKNLSHKTNSVKYYGNYCENNEIIIVMEKCDLNLKDFIKQRGKALDIIEIKNKFNELNELFEYMQEERIIHRDLKLENLFVKYINKAKNEYIIKLGDYGASKTKSYITNGIYSGLKGTIETIAPEIILEKTKSYESIIDIYSLGVILYH